MYITSFFYIRIICLDLASGLRAVATTSSDELALLRRRAHAAAAAAEGRTAALGLALVVLEHEQRIRTRLKGRSHQWLIWRRRTPRTDIVASLEANVIKRSNRAIALTRATRLVQEVARKALRTKRTGLVVDHQNIGSE